MPARASAHAAEGSVASRRRRLAQAVRRFIRAAPTVARAEVRSICLRLGIARLSACPVGRLATARGLVDAAHRAWKEARS